MSKLMKKSQDKKQIYQEQIFTCCFKYPVMNTNTHRNTHTHTATHTGTYTHIWMGQCTLIRDGMSLDAAIRVLLQHLGTHTVQKPLLTLGSGVASLPSHQAASCQLPARPGEGVTLPTSAPALLQVLWAKRLLRDPSTHGHPCKTKTHNFHLIS